MNEVKPGHKTTEFWMTSISGVIVAVLMVLVGYNVLTKEQSELWSQLAFAVLPIALAVIVGFYSDSRGKVKGGK